MLLRWLLVTVVDGAAVDTLHPTQRYGEGQEGGETPGRHYLGGRNDKNNYCKCFFCWLSVNLIHSVHSKTKWSTIFCIKLFTVAAFKRQLLARPLWLHRCYQRCAVFFFLLIQSPAYFECQKQSQSATKGNKCISCAPVTIVTSSSSPLPPWAFWLGS